MKGRLILHQPSYEESYEKGSYMSDFLTIGTKVVPENFGPLRGSNGNARLKGPCGDTMEFWIKVQNGIIEDVHYTTDGCYFSNKCGTTAALMSCSVPVTIVEQFTQADILSVAGDIPPDDSHCALLAVNTLKKAIEDYKNKEY